MKYYLIYKITNQINGKFYIGKRVATDPNDSYTGSGKLIRRAVKKYGKENFSKEILFYLDDKEAMAKKETEIVTEALINDPQCYNLRLGGKGGFTLEEARKGNKAMRAVGGHRKGGRASIKKRTKEQLSEWGKKGGAIIGERLRGVSKTGNVTWNTVRHIRTMYKSNITRKNIQKKYPKLTQSTVNDIVAQRTWKE